MLFQRPSVPVTRSGALLRNPIRKQLGSGWNHTSICKLGASAPADEKGDESHAQAYGQHFPEASQKRGFAHHRDKIGEAQNNQRGGQQTEN